MDHSLKCIDCGASYGADSVIYRCRQCNGLLDVDYDYSTFKPLLQSQSWAERPFGTWKYRELLPIKEESRVISLGEGGTSLRRCDRLSRELKTNKIQVKNEGENPTGSFKDRGMTVGVSRAVELGAETIACASTGNTSASVAAYAALAGLRCIVLIPSGKIALGKLAQAVAYGARIVEVQGNFDDALQLVVKLTDLHQDIYLLNSINPYRLEGQKTLSYEICDQMNWRTPDVVVVPVGNAGNISSIWKGFKEMRQLGLVERLPRMVGVQAEGAAPIATAFKKGSDEITPIENPQTVASAIRIGSPVSWKKALKALRESGGVMETVSDEEITQAQRLLARREGIFVEPASASSIAVVRKLLGSAIDKNEEVVCVATGHGLKDPDTVMKGGMDSVEVEPSVEKVEAALGLKR